MNEQSNPAITSTSTEMNTEETKSEAIGKRWLENSSLENWFPFTAQELTTLRTQVEVLTGQLERSQKAVLEWEDREAKVCPENVSFESVIERLTKERESWKVIAERHLDHIHELTTPTKA